MQAELAVRSKTEERALAMVRQANEIAVTDQASHDYAGELYVQLGDVAKEIDSIFDPSIEAAHASHKAALAAKAKLAGPVAEARRIVKPKVTAWEEDQKRIAAEKQRQAEEAARKIEEESSLALAAEAETKGATPETVNEILETPVVTIAPVVQPAFAKVNGFTSRECWSAEVVDLKALCRAVADGKQPIGLIQANQVALNNMAKALKGLMQVPGVRAVKRMV
jgi:hypothetical protein